MTTVELHVAFLFVCETCGRDNFVRAVRFEDEQVRAMAEHPGHEGMIDALDLVDAMRDAASGDAPVGAAWCMAPERVTCGHCGTEFETSED